MDVRVGLWRRLSAEELMLLNCGVGEDSWESLGLQGDPTSPSQRRSVLGVHWKDWCWSWETPILWPPHEKSWLIGKDPDAGRDWGQEEKGMTEDEMAGWHHWLDGHESEWTPGVGDGQEAWCAAIRGVAKSRTRLSDWTELNWTELAISYLTTSNVPWFMDLTFQVPMQYCSLQHRTLLLSPVTSTTCCCFCFGSVPLFFLELFLHWSPVAYWALNDLGSSSFSVLSFCLFILFISFYRQGYWSALPFLSPVDHICQNSPPWPVCLGWPYMAWLSFIDLDKAVVHVIRMASCLWFWFQSVFPLMPPLSALSLAKCGEIIW